MTNELCKECECDGGTKIIREDGVIERVVCLCSCHQEEKMSDETELDLESISKNFKRYNHRDCLECIQRLLEAIIPLSKLKLIADKAMKESLELADEFDEDMLNAIKRENAPKAENAALKEEVEKLEGFKKSVDDYTEQQRIGKKEDD